MLVVKVRFCQKVLITPNRRTSFFPETENMNFGDFLGCPSQELVNLLRNICPSQPKVAFLSLQFKPLTFQNLKHPQFLSNFQSPNLKFSVSGKKNVRLFGVVTKTSVSSDKNVPLPFPTFRFHKSIKWKPEMC